MGQTQIDDVLHVAGSDAGAMEEFGDQGVLNHGLAVLGDDATLLASITVFIIERDFKKAPCFAVAGAVFTLFGLIHADALGFGQTLLMAVSNSALRLSCMPALEHRAQNKSRAGSPRVRKLALATTSKLLATRPIKRSAL